jgi:ribosomal protein S18 acetylase RimI-like enzyme
MKDLGNDPMARQVTLRRGTPDDAELLVKVFTLASEGIANHFWAQTAAREGRTEREIALDRMAGKLADPANRVWIAEVDGQPAGAILIYAIGAAPEPLDDLPPLVVPLVGLENQAPGTVYVNVLAVLAEFRRLGIATRLLARAAEEAGDRPLSLIVSDANTGARAAYEAFGFRYGPSAPMVKDGWQGRGENWLLMTRARAHSTRSRSGSSNPS